MKTTLLAFAITAAGLFAMPTISHAADNGNGGFFVNGNVGQSNLSKGVYDDNDNGYGMNLGYRWAINPSVALGVEGGYADLGKFGVKDSLSGNNFLNQAQIKGWTAGVNGHFNLTPNWYLSGRAGLFRADVKGSYLTSSTTAAYVDDTASKYYAGAGFGYDFNTNLSVGLNYDYYKVDKNGLNLEPSLVSVSGEYRF